MTLFTFNPDDTIGPYRVVKGLGQGRTAQVYLVDDDEQCQYALKVLHPSVFQSQKDIEKLKREAYVYNKLFGKKSYIAKIYGYKHLQAYNNLECHCLLVEYAGSEHLGDYLKQKKRLSIQKTLQIAWQVSNALEYTHPFKVIHRDLKPQNIILGVQYRIPPQLDKFQEIAGYKNKLNLTRPRANLVKIL